MQSGLTCRAEVTNGRQASPAKGLALVSARCAPSLYGVNWCAYAVRIRSRICDSKEENILKQQPPDTPYRGRNTFVAPKRPQPPTEEQNLPLHSRLNGASKSGGDSQNRFHSTVERPSVCLHIVGCLERIQTKQFKKQNMHKSCTKLRRGHRHSE